MAPRPSSVASAGSPGDVDRKDSLDFEQTKLVVQPLDPQYEGRHRYAPEAEWEEEEENRLKRKM